MLILTRNLDLTPPNLDLALDVVALDLALAFALAQPPHGLPAMRAEGRHNFRASRREPKWLPANVLLLML